jgi:HlyD family secretion protein
MLREVRATGTLVPRTSRWLAAATAAQVEQILVWPGTAVQPDTLLMKLSNPEVEDGLRNAQAQVAAAQAEVAAKRAELQSQLLDERSAEAQAQSDYASAKVKADADAKAVAEHLIPEVRFEQEQIALAQLQNRMRIERERVKAFGGSMRAQLDAVKAKLLQQQSNLQLRQRQADALEVKAGIAGVLQEVAVQEGGVSLSVREGAPGVVAKLWLPLLLSQEPVGDEPLP